MKGQITNKKKQRNKTNTAKTFKYHPRVLTAVKDVAVADLGVNQECWQVLCRLYEDKESFIMLLMMNISSSFFRSYTTTTLGLSQVRIKS